MRTSALSQAASQNAVKSWTCLKFASWPKNIKSKPSVAQTVTPEASAAFLLRSVRQSNMVPTCRRWQCICTRGNCSPRLAPARLSLRSVGARSRKPPCCSGANWQQSGTFAWQKFSKRFLTPFGVLLGHRFLPHPQLSFDYAQARASHAVCSYCCLPWSTFTGRLGT